MNLEELFKLILSNPEKLNVEYSYIDGVESLKINGEEVSEKKFDDTEVKELIKDYADIIEELDDCVFGEVLDRITPMFDLKEFDSLLKQKSFDEPEAEFVIEVIDKIKSIIKECLVNKIDSISSLLERI